MVCWVCVAREIHVDLHEEGGTEKVGVSALKSRKNAAKFFNEILDSRKFPNNFLLPIKL